MNKHISMWDQDELRKAMAASVPPEMKPKTPARRPGQPPRPGSLSSRTFEAMELWRWYTARELSQMLGAHPQTTSNALRDLKDQGRIKKEMINRNVAKYRRIK